MYELVKSSFYNGLNINYEIFTNNPKLISDGKGAGYDFTFTADPIPEVDNDTLFDSTFDADFTESKKTYYLLAGVSGLVTGVISSVFGNNTDLANWTSLNLKQLIIKIAKASGCRISQNSTTAEMYEAACAFLKHTVAVDPDGAINPVSLNGYAGLALLILSQLSGKKILFSEDNGFTFENAPIDDTSPKTIPEKILFAVLIWFINVLITVARGGDAAMAIKKNLPEPVFEFINSLAKSRIVAEIANDYTGSVFPLALALLNWVRTGTEMDIDGVGFLKAQAIPVILNECVVRTGYMFIRLHAENKRGNIKSLRDLMHQSLDAILPKDNRTLLRMLTISSGTFVAVTTAGATIKAFVASRAGLDPAAFAKTFALNINYVGIGRFVFALKKDWEYIKEDFDQLLKRMKQQTEIYNMITAKLTGSFRCLSLDPEQARILYSLEWQKVYYDVLNTKDAQIRERKRNWLNAWEYGIITALNESPDYFIKDENKVYDAIANYTKSPDKRWLLLTALELQLFKAYSPLSLEKTKEAEEKEKQYKGLKYNASYGRKVFCMKQSTVGVKQYEDLYEARKRYSKQLNDNLPAVFIGVAAVAVVALATGGAALAFAPQIAVAIAGPAVAGLHGAALASASLAFVGGGALAVGGLGIAGGTAIIAGGGALLGAVVSGASVATIGYLSSKGNLINECAKLLTYSEKVLLDYCHDVASVKDIRNMLSSDLSELEEDITSMESNETDSVKKKQISESRNNLKYIRTTIKKLDELLKNQPVVKETRTQYTYFTGCRTEEDVKERYKALMKVFHPDICDDGGVTARIINEEKAQILKDIKDRKQQ